MSKDSEWSNKMCGGVGSVWIKVDSAPHHGIVFNGIKLDLKQFHDDMELCGAVLLSKSWPLQIVASLLRSSNLPARLRSRLPYGFA